MASRETTIMWWCRQSTEIQDNPVRFSMFVAIAFCHPDADYSIDSPEDPSCVGMTEKLL